MDDKIVNYNSQDPRYNLTIKDSNRHNLFLHPASLYNKCKTEQNDCINQRYENCEKQTSFDCLIDAKPNEIEETIRELKNVNTNSFYDISRIPKSSNILINEYPDVKYIENFDVQYDFTQWLILFVIIILMLIIIQKNMFVSYKL